MKHAILTLLLALAWTHSPAADRNFAVVPAQSHAGGPARIALVIGNNAYTSVTALQNPKSDSLLIADILKKQGFELVDDKALLDLDLDGMKKAVQKFSERLEQNPGAVALFYYAGHGIQNRGDNFLIPVDAKIKGRADIELAALKADQVLQRMQDAKTNLNMVILDACRDDPFPEKTRSIGGSGGLAQMEAPKGTLIVYSTAPGKTAKDGPPGGNSPFAKSLAESLKQPGQKVLDTFNDAGLRLLRDTQDEQQPWVSSTPIEGAFCFAGCAGGGHATPPPAQSRPAVDELVFGPGKSEVTKDQALFGAGLSQRFVKAIKESMRNGDVAVLYPGDISDGAYDTLAGLGVTLKNHNQSDFVVIVK